jgi:hypothetical protein
MPFAMGLKFAGTGSEGRVDFKSGGMKADIGISREKITLEADLGKGFSASLVYGRSKEPLSLLTRNGLKGFNYTDKEAGISAGGTIKAGGAEYRLDPASASGILDYTFGLPARETFWNWASGCGTGANGEKIAFNFAQGINETGFTENVFWINGALTQVDTVNFIYDGRDMMSPWKLKSADGKVDLAFTPEGRRAKDLNFGFIKSYFCQPFGTFSGTLVEKEKKYEIREVYGFTEEHMAKW